MNCCFVCSAELANLSKVRHHVRENAQLVCADEDFLYDLMLSVDEVVTNIIVHGYQGAAGEIAIDMYAQTDRLYVVISDNAPCFDPCNTPDPDCSLPLDKRRPGGLGLTLVRSLMDGVVYAPGSGSGNQLTLIKRYPDECRQTQA